MRLKFTFLIILFLSLVTGYGQSTHAPQGPSIITDAIDYVPGSVVKITGNGFSSGEIVILQVKHNNGSFDNGSSAAHQPWSATADANGNINTVWTVPLDQDELGSYLLATAVGQTSGLKTTWSFTDSAPLSATYTYVVSTGGVLSTGGTNILPNKGDEGISVPVPFDLTIYDQTFTTGTNVFIPTKGNMQFTSTSINYSPNCLPTATFSGINLCPYWSDFKTQGSDASFGVFSSVVGTAPNREWHIRWKVNYWTGPGHAEFELVLHESLANFEFIYGDVTPTTGNDVTGATIGIQSTSSCGKQYLCKTTNGIPAGTIISYTGQTAASPTAPVLAATLSNLCSGQSTALSISSGTLNDALGWKWYSASCGGTLVGSGTSINVSPNTTTTYFARGEGGCVSAGTCGSTIINVSSVPSKPTITAGSATTFCPGGSVILTSNAASGNQWFLNGTAITGEIGTTYTATASGNYTVQSTNSGGCASPLSNATTISVYPLPATPNVTAGSATSFCQGGSVILTSDAATGNQWFLNGTAISGATEATYTSNASGDYTAQTTNGNGCVSASSSTTTIAVYPVPAAPNVSAGSATTFCQGGSVLLTSDAAIGNQWYLNGTAISGATAKTYSVSASGGYTVQSTNINGCISVISSATTITVNPTPATPTITAGSATTFCQGGSVLFTSSAGTGNQWYLNGASISGSINATYTANSSGSYTVKTTNSNACTSLLSVAKTVTVNPLPIGTVSSSVDYVCDQANLTLNAVGGATYVWYKAGVVIPNATTSSVAITSSGVYNAKLISSFGCEALSTNSLTIKQYYAPQVDFISQYSCINKPVNITNASNITTSGTVKYLWDNGASGSSTIANPVFTYSSTGNKTIQLTVTPDNCPALKQTISKTIAIESPTPAVRLPIKDVIVAEPTILDARTFGSSYEWTPSGILISNDRTAHPTVTVNEQTVYNIKITVPSSCETNDTLLVRVFKERTVFLPNVFTPNGDGINDIFRINPVGMKMIKYFRIFNQWGHKVFETNNINEGWDGKYNGILEPLATYTWLIDGVDVNGKIIQQTGSVTLLR